VQAAWASASSMGKRQQHGQTPAAWANASSMGKPDAL